MATLDLNQVSKSFGAAKVLHDINLAIEDKEFVVFVGHLAVVNQRFCGSSQA